MPRSTATWPCMPNNKDAIQICRAVWRTRRIASADAETVNIVLGRFAGENHRQVSQQSQIVSIGKVAPKAPLGRRRLSSLDS
ncbi:hypothetical protein, partial [Mesorhizobium sp. M2D.F.Ca.ET.223.01.1.1]|uniref:hypothetical protein n=1 Tax=Mesorhizobium sp. M2D.F.Ca.ET.223.01.1.1 TaxID=2563940 RepID=UPI001AED5277